MTYKARFIHGSRIFNLDSGEYDLHTDFVFPAADESLNVALASPGSMTGGGVISKTAQDRWWAWSVVVQGTSETHTHQAAARLSAWLNGALGDKSSKLYFEYTPNYVVPAPVWGQHGQPYRFEVKDAMVSLDASYYSYEWAGGVLILPISLYVGPYALGARQRLAQAKGGMIENTIGTVDGLPRGTIIASATTNKMTNPIFGHGTPLNDWLAGADLTATANTNTDYILWGSASAKVTRVSAGANYTFTQSIAAGNTNAHYLQAYVKAHDSSVLTASVVNLYYGATITTTYTALGNGWYMLSAAVTGIAAATLTGLRVAGLNTPIYVAGVQLAELADLTPMTHGDMIGCSWSGTAHASTSVRVVAYERIATSGLINVGGGSIRVAVRHMAAAAGHSYDRVLFTDGKIIAYIENSNAEYYFGDGTNTISGGTSQTFTSGEIQVLHFVWGAAGLKTYLNGALYDSGATLTPWTVGEYLYIGSNATPLGHFNGTFLDFAIFDQPLTAAQVAADYAQISPHVRGGDGKGQRLSSIPYLWTKDGDNQIEFYTDATHNHWAVAAGLQGSMEAETEIRGTVDSTAYYARLYFSNLAVRKYYNPGTLFEDQSGTNTAATDVGSAVKTTSLSTSGLALSTSLEWTHKQFPEMAGKSFMLIARIKDSVGSNYLRMSAWISFGSRTLAGDYSRPYATSSTLYYNLATPMASIVDASPIASDFLGDISYTTWVVGYRNTGTNNLLVDYIALFPDNALYIESSSIKTFILNGRNCFGYDSIPLFQGRYTVNGNPLDFTPNRYNILQALPGNVSTDSSVIADTLTYDIYYTPRYLIL